MAIVQKVYEWSKGQLDHSSTFWTMANYTTMDCPGFFETDVIVWREPFSAVEPSMEPFIKNVGCTPAVFSKVCVSRYLKILNFKIYS